MAGMDFTNQSIRDPDAQRRLELSRGRALSSAQANLESDLSRMGLDPARASEAVHSFRPDVDSAGDPVSRFDPDAAEQLAADIEAKYGDALDRPGWRNAELYAKGGAEYAKTHADQHGSIDEAYTASRHLMSPERAAYMQHVGRTVDLLRGLRSGDPSTAPQVAMKYYRNSWQNPLAKGGWGEATYQREADDTMGRPIAGFLQDPTSPPAWYLRTGNLAPVMIRSTADGASTAAANAVGFKDFQDRFKDLGSLGEVADAPSSATPAEYARRMAEIQKLGGDIQPPSWQAVVGSAPPAVADALGYAGESLDASMGAALLSSPLRMIGRSLLSRVPLTIKAAAPLTARGVGAAFIRQGLEEGAGEVPMASAGAITQAVAPSERSWMDYFFGKGIPEQRDPAATTRAASVLAGLKRTSPNDIWSARSKYDPMRTAPAVVEPFSPAY